MKRSISDFLYDACVRDDRTGLPSTTKFIRMGTWFLGVMFSIATMIIAFIRDIQLTPEDISVLNLCKEFLIFFIPATEASYQFNRNAKLKSSGLSDVVQERAKKQLQREFKEDRAERVDI
jgi:hypothetical protein